MSLKIELVICIETLAIYGRAEKNPFYNLKIYSLVGSFIQLIRKLLTDFISNRKISFIKLGSCVRNK